MNVYSYCNYRDSSVGFQIGQVDLNTGKIVRSNIHSYIIKCFESNLVDVAYGSYPLKEEKSYFYLIKNINYLNQNHKTDKYMNVAFEFSDVSMVSSFRNFFKNKSKDDIALIFGDIIFVDTSNPEYEMKFDEKKLLNLIDTIKGMNCSYSTEKSPFCIVSSSSVDRTNELLELLKLNKRAYELKKREQNDSNFIYIFAKKKLNPQILIPMLLVITVIILILIFLIQ